MSACCTALRGIRQINDAGSHCRLEIRRDFEKEQCKLQIIWSALPSLAGQFTHYALEAMSNAFLRLRIVWSMRSMCIHGIQNLSVNTAGWETCSHLMRELTPNDEYG